MAKIRKKHSQLPITVIIPTLLADPTWLQRTLLSLEKQRCTKPFLVLVVVNASQARLEQVLPELDVNKLTLQLEWLVQGSNTGFTHAVNRGIRTTKSRVIALVNDDVWLEPTWLESMLETQRKTKADMVASTVLAPKSATVSWPIKPVQWQMDSCGFDFAWRGKAWPLLPDADGNLQSPLSNAWDNWLQHIDMLGSKAVADTKQPFGADGAAALYTSKLFQKIGPFKRSFFAYLEDVELSLRARQNGFICRWSEGAVAYHAKHATAKTMGNFKAKQDVKNWWRMLFSFPFEAWWRFGVSILIERIRNFSGLIKQL